MRLVVIIAILFQSNFAYANDDPDYLDEAVINNRTDLFLPVSNILVAKKVTIIEMPSLIHPGINILKAKGYSEEDDSNYSLLRYTFKIGDPANPKGQCFIANRYVYGLHIEYGGDGSGGFRCNEYASEKNPTIDFK